MDLWGGYGLETVLIRTVIEEWNMGRDYVIEMDFLVIILIQQNYCRSHVNCSEERSCLRGAFPPASKLITALLKWEMAFPVLLVRDKYHFSLARNLFLPSHFLLPDPPPAIGAKAPARWQDPGPFPLPAPSPVWSQVGQVHPHPMGWTNCTLKLQVRGCSCSRILPRQPVPVSMGMLKMRLSLIGSTLALI